MRKLNRVELLLILLAGLLASPQSIWANDTKMDQANSIPAIESQSNVRAYDVSRDGRDGDDTSKPGIIIAGQYSIGDDFTTLGRPADIGC